LGAAENVSLGITAAGVLLLQKPAERIGPLTFATFPAERIAGGIFAFENEILTRADAKTGALPGFSAAPVFL